MQLLTGGRFLENLIRVLLFLVLEKMCHKLRDKDGFMCVFEGWGV